jgi:hypothetical protein
VANVPAVTVGGTTSAGSASAAKGSRAGAGSPSVARVATVPAGGVASTKGFPKSAEERQQLLQLRKQQMVEEARR